MIDINSGHFDKTPVGPQAGFSLIELTIVIVVIGILATIVMQSMAPLVEDSRRTKTEREMEMLAEAIVGNTSITTAGKRSDFGYVGDIGSFPTNLQALYQNPGSYATWDGPYVDPGFAQDSTGFKTDEWGTLYQYSGGITITSTGSGSTITKKIADAASDYLLNSLNATISDAGGGVPGTIYQDSIDIRVTIPDGSGSTTTKTYTPDSAGAFILDSLPAGQHPLRIIYTPNVDTLFRYLTILPRHKSSGAFRFSQDYFSGGGGSSDSVIYEEFTEAKASSNVNSITISTPGGTSQGNLLIAVVVTDGNKSSSLSPPGGEGWTEVNISNQTGTVTLGVWWKQADASESSSHQFTWSGGGQEACAWMMRFTGHDPSSAINASAINGGSSSSPTCPSVTTTVTNTMIVRIGGFDDDDINVDNTGLSGHTDITMDESGSGSGTCSGGAGYARQAAIGASGTADFSLTASEQWRTVTIAIAPAP